MKSSLNNMRWEILSFFNIILSEIYAQIFSDGVSNRCPFNFHGLFSESGDEM